MLLDELQPPKTRHNSRGRSKEVRSTSSSRLKSFPAEKMKKLDDPPTFSPEPISALIVQQNPKETGTFFIGTTAGNNNGHGDATSAQSPSPLPQQQKLPNVSSTNQQQVVKCQQMDQANPQFESLLTRQVVSSERQAHRPLVPNTFQGIAIRDRSPRNLPTSFSHPVIIQDPSTQSTVVAPQLRQPLCDLRTIVDQDRDKTVAFSDCRNASDHRQMQQQTQAAGDTNTPLNTRSTNNCQGVHLQDVHRAQSHGPFNSQISQQIYQQSQHNLNNRPTPQHTLDHARSMYNQQQQMYNNSMICCNCSNQQLTAAQLPRQGMTSPQDMTMNQIKLMQHNSPIHQQNLQYPVHLQPALLQNERWIHTTNNNQYLHQQSSPQQQYYYQTRDIQNPDYYQQTFGSQDQSISPQNQINRECTNEQSATKPRSRKGDDKKVLQFTPDMIRDQELLVSTMRQQGVSDEVMRRQFEALLNEQRRHLVYLAQFQEPEDASEVKQTYRYVQRRTDRDEKPEWMLHITPPRISYSEVEKIKMQQKVTKERYPMDQSSQEISRAMPIQQYQSYKNAYHQQMKKETTDQAIPHQQMYLQRNPHQPWQQQGISLPCRSHADYQNQAPCNYANSYSYNYQQNQSNQSNNIHYQPVFNETSNQQHFCQYSHNMRYNPYAHPEQQKVCFKGHNVTSSDPTNSQKVPADSAHFYEQRKRSTEHSSLLKMRVYREVIRPQKRNNGLQDLDTIQKALEMLKDPASKKGLEYLANLAKKKPAVKLNGTQDPDEILENQQPRSLLETTSQTQKRISSNGLENSRNANNPQPCILRPKRADEPVTTEYPRQRLQPGICDIVQSGKQKSTTAISQQRDHAAAVSRMLNAESVPYDHQNTLVTQGYRNSNDPSVDPSMMLRFGATPHCHQMQQYYLNRRNMAGHNGGQGDIASIPRQDAPGAMGIDRAGGDTGENSSPEETTKRVGGVRSTCGTSAYDQPEISEGRTMDCTACFARKPDYAVNNLIVSPDKLIASRHLQPPMIL